jgi:hypothetical protein
MWETVPTMNPSRDEVQRRLQVWLEARNLVPELEPVGSNTNFLIRLQGEIGNWQCRILVEDSHGGELPGVIHFISRVPIRVPRSRVEDVAVVLHSLTRYVKYGFLSMDSKDRTVFYRLTVNLDERTPCEETFAFALRQSIFYMEEHAGFICFFAHNSEKNHQRARYHLEKSGLGNEKFSFPGEYPGASCREDAMEHREPGESDPGTATPGS